MKWLLYLLAALLAAVTAGTFIARDAGRVIFIWGGWTVESSAVLFIAALLAGAFLLHLVLRLLRGLLRLPDLLRRWRGDRRALQAEELLARGLQEMLVGDWPRAERDMKRWAARGCNPMLGYLYAARAASAQGAERRRDHYLKLAADASRSEVDLVMARAELLPDLPGARADVERIAAQDPGVAATPAARRAVLASALERQAWGDARRQLAALYKAREMDAEEADAVERRIAMAAIAAAENEGALIAAWTGIPKDLRRDADLVERYVRARLRVGTAADCEPLLSEALARAWSPALVRLYGEVQGENPGRRLRIAEGWLKRHGPDADLLLTLGRLALLAGDGERGRAWLEESLRHRPSAAACRELGRWFEQQGDTGMALKYYRQGLASPA